MIRILVVDDDEFCRSLLRKTLNRLPETNVVEAENGAQAITIAHEGKLDLILLDIMMPVMDGLEFLRQSAADEQISGVPVVMITAKSSSEDSWRARTLGASDCIIKPWRDGEVERRVGRVLRAVSAV